MTKVINCAKHNEWFVYGKSCPGCDKETKAFDPVTKPAHYNQAGIECIDAIKAALGDDGFAAYCRGNALKYIWRCEYKGATSQDLAKAIWYTRMANGDDPRVER